MVCGGRNSAVGNPFVKCRNHPASCKNLNGGKMNIFNIIDGVVYLGTQVIMKAVSEDVVFEKLTRKYGEDIIVLY